MMAASADSYTGSTRTPQLKAMTGRLDEGMGAGFCSQKQARLHAREQSSFEGPGLRLRVQARAGFRARGLVSVCGSRFGAQGQVCMRGGKVLARGAHCRATQRMNCQNTADGFFARRR